MPSGIGLVVILPDAVRLRLVPAIGDYLGSRRLVPVGVRSVALSARDTEAMYGGQLRSKTSGSGRRHGPVLTSRLFSLDNSLVVLLRGEAGTDVPRVVHDLKGPSSYLQRRPGSLRMLSSVEDRCMSLVHTPDDARQTAEHARHFFPGQALPGDDVIDWDLVADCRSLSTPDPAASRYAVLAALLLRVVSVCTAHGLVAEQAEPLGYARKLLREWLATPPMAGRAEHERFTDAMREVAVLGIHASSCRGAAETARRLVEVLAHPDGYGFELADEVLAHLAELSLLVTDFEEHWLRVLLTFFHE